MNTKGKLNTIMAIFSTALLLTVSYLSWNSWVTYRLVNTVTPALGSLRLLNEIQSRLHRQQHALVHFVATGEENARQDLFASRAVIEANLLRLDDLVKEQQTRGWAKGEVVAANDLKIVRERYNQYLKKAAKCLQEKLLGNTEAALQVMDTDSTPYLETEVLAVLDKMDREQTQVIHHTYQSIILKIGALPWITASGLNQVARSSSGVDCDLAISAAELGLYRQMNELIEFLLHGETQDWEEFLEHRFEVRRLLEEWHQVILRQQAMGIAGEEQDEKEFEELRERYENLLPLMDKSIEIRHSQGRDAGLEYVEHTLMEPLEKDLFPELEVIGKESREEVKELHDGLLQTVLVGGAGGVGAIVLVSGLMLLLIMRMSNNIISSLVKLKKGTEIIKSGNLEYQIRIAGRDEFSELATSFNAMTDSLKEQNDELRAFVFSIAHDLRAPLVNLKGFSSELRRDLAEVMPPLLLALNSLSAVERQRVVAVLEQAVPEALGYIDTSTQKLDSLINAVLHLSRIDFRELNLEGIDTEELVQVALQNLAHTINTKNITVHLGPLPPLVADRMVMEQCIANLLDNACKYLVPNRAGEISITAGQDKDAVIFYFKDNGRGIAPDDIQKVFEIFRRAGQPDTPGEGMGLAFVKALARRQGGNVWCESVLGEGTTFCLSIPADGGQRRGI